MTIEIKTISTTKTPIMCNDFDIQYVESSFQTISINKRGCEWLEVKTRLILCDRSKVSARYPTLISSLHVFTPLPSPVS